jgi:hypothetical protein
MIDRYYFSLDPEGTSGTPTIFAGETSITGNPSYYQSTINLTGAVGASVSIQVNITNDNDAGEVLVNGVQIFNNNTFTIVLDGSGNGNFIGKIQGDAGNTGTATLAKFSIQSVTAGQIGSPSTIQISKAF